MASGLGVGGITRTFNPRKAFPRKRGRTRCGRGQMLRSHLPAKAIFRNTKAHGGRGWISRVGGRRPGGRGPMLARRHHRSGNRRHRSSPAIRHCLAGSLRGSLDDRKHAASRRMGLRNDGALFRKPARSRDSGRVTHFQWRSQTRRAEAGRGLEHRHDFHWRAGLATWRPALPWDLCLVGGRPGALFRRSCQAIDSCRVKLRRPRPARPYPLRNFSMRTWLRADVRAMYS